jgi:hypothetical protein
VKPGAILLAAATALAAASMAVAMTRDGHAVDMSAGAPDGSVRRLTEAQYRRAIADVFGPDIRVVGRFEPDKRVDGLVAVGSSMVSVTASGFDQYEQIARGIAEQVVDKDHRSTLVGCEPVAGDADGRACVSRFFARVGPRLYRRAMAPAEVARFTAATLEAGRTLGDFHAGVAAGLTAMLSSPEFLFRFERPAADGRLDGYARASRISFLLWNAPPDAALMEAAAAGALDRPEGVAAQIDRLMASPRFEDGIRAFFTDFLLLDDLDTLSKDSLLFPQFNANVAGLLKEQTLRTVVDLLVTNKGDYRDLFTTRRIAMHRALGPIYTVPVAGGGWSMYEFPEGDPRTGLLTHAGLLALHSHPGRTSPTLRGKAIQEALLCTKVPSPPANVSFAVVQDVNNATLKTTRARLKAHLDDEECASCHRVTDPIGLALEQFDGVGQHRLTERGEPIDASGTFGGASFTDAVGLGKLFHDNAAMSACAVRTAWRYAAGRDPLPGDEPAIATLQRDFPKMGYRMTDLMRAIALSITVGPAAKEPGSRRQVAIRTGVPLS